MTIQNVYPLSDSIKEILKAPNNVAAKRKKCLLIKKKKKAQIEVIIRIHIRTIGYENYCSIKSGNSVMSPSGHEILDNITCIA